MSTGYQFIEDLPESWPEWASSLLAGLASDWREQREKLGQSEALVQFNTRLGREWAIETGIIENLYTLDRGTTEVLVEHGINASLIPRDATNRPVELVAAFLGDQEQALEGLFEFVAQRRELSNAYIKQLHQVFTQHQPTVEALDAQKRVSEIPLIHGDWKKWPNNPMRSDGTMYIYCPPEHVAAEMDRLIGMHVQHEASGVPPEIEAAWLHHRFTQIHPFQDGNGRLARSLASLVFLKAGWFPIVISRDLRSEYITALEEADAGNLKTLIALFARLQEWAFMHALNLSDSVLMEGKPADQIIDAALERLIAKSNIPTQRSKELAYILEQISLTRLQGLANQLDAPLRSIKAGYGTEIRTLDYNQLTYHQELQEVLDVARNFGYHADIRAYLASNRLIIHEQRIAGLAVVFHALSNAFSGILVASAFIDYGNFIPGQGVVLAEGPYPLCKEVFPFSDKESEEEIVRRFKEWLEGVIVSGLDQWRRQL